MKAVAMFRRLLLCGLVGAVSFASQEGAGEEQESPDALINRYRYSIEKTLSEVKTLQPACQQCEIFQAGADSTVYSPACRQKYRDFYKIKDRLSSERPEDASVEIRLAIGYMDYKRSVEDAYVAAAFATSLKQLCTAGRSACGFRQDPDDAELFTKVLWLLGPDGKRRRRIVKLRLQSSSVTADERLNQPGGLYAKEQDEQSERTKRFFEEGLSHSDMVLYVGHARGGGGPGFRPPQVNPRTRRTDYDWHRANPAGRDGMLAALKQTRTPAKIVGLFACDSKDHFGAALMSASPKSMFVLSGKNEFEASVGQAAATLDSVLGLKCDPDFANSVNHIKEANGARVGPVSVGW